MGRFCGHTNFCDLHRHIHKNCPFYFFDPPPRFMFKKNLNPYFSPKSLTQPPDSGPLSLKLWPLPKFIHLCRREVKSVIFWIVVKAHVWGIKVLVCGGTQSETWGTVYVFFENAIFMGLSKMHQVLWGYQKCIFVVCIGKKCHIFTGGCWDFSIFKPPFTIANEMDLISMSNIN